MHVVSAIHSFFVRPSSFHAPRPLRFLIVLLFCNLPTPPHSSRTEAISCPPSCKSAPLATFTQDSSASHNPGRPLALHAPEPGQAQSCHPLPSPLTKSPYHIFYYNYEFTPLLAGQAAVLISRWRSTSKILAYSFEKEDEGEVAPEVGGEGVDEGWEETWPS